ncbi:unnamed protein product [Arctogadus glacialis]
MGPVAFQRKTLPPKPQSDWQHCANKTLIGSERAELEPINRRGEDWATAWERGAPSRRNNEWRRARRYEGVEKREEIRVSGEERGDTREWRRARRYE